MVDVLCEVFALGFGVIRNSILKLLFMQENDVVENLDQVDEASPADGTRIRPIVVQVGQYCVGDFQSVRSVVDLQFDSE